MARRLVMGRRLQCVVALVVLSMMLFVSGRGLGVEGKEEEFEGFDGLDGLEKEELDAPFVVPVRTRAQSSGGGGLDVGMDVGVKVEPRSRVVDPVEYWDEDEFEGLPVEGSAAGSGVVADPVGLEATGAAMEIGKGSGATGKSSLSPYLEVVGVIFFLVYGVVFWYGRKENEKIAVAWATEFAGTDSIFEKNFTLIGFGDGADAASLVKEGMSNFKFYASGRRFCESLLATMVLKNRQDLLSQLLYRVMPGRDEITIQVNMNEDAMEPIVFALTQKKKAKDMQRDVSDLYQFATVLTPPTSRRWVSDDLAVISESRELAVDLLPEVLLDQMFGDKAFAAVAPYFVSLHFSDQFPESNHKKVLQFTFVIPPLEKLSEMKRLIALVPYFIDMMGRYKMGSSVKSKATAAREKIRAEEFKEIAKARQEALQKKKSEQQTPMSSKKEEKERLRQLKKSMPKVKVSRGH